MKTEVIFNPDLHFEHQLWLNELSFWRDELKSFTMRLDELVNRWTDKEVLKELEHFQNEFYIHSETMDALKDDIERHEINIAEHSTMGNSEVLDTVFVKKHLVMRERMETQRELYGELKKAFFRFLTKYM